MLTVLIIAYQSNACSLNCTCIDTLSIIMCRNIHQPPVMADSYKNEGRHIIIENSNLSSMNAISQFFPVAEYIKFKNTIINCTLIHSTSVYIEADLCIKSPSAVRSRPKLPTQMYTMNPHLTQHLGINVIIIITCVLNIGSITIYAITKNR